jgi:hypothetical protein
VSPLVGPAFYRGDGAARRFSTSGAKKPDPTITGERPGQALSMVLLKAC